MIEIEIKFAVLDLPGYLNRLSDFGATRIADESHSDTYYSHPCRDFQLSGEALRLRRINGQGFVTYKGPKQSDEVKVREEIEYCLAPGDQDGQLTETIWGKLGFRTVATVAKQRTVYQLNRQNLLAVVEVPALDGQVPDVIATVDDVQSVGVYSELELIVEDPNDTEKIELYRKILTSVANKLDLSSVEKRSYLSLLLARSHD